MLNEIWKDIPEYEGFYQVSTLGNVRSLDRLVGAKNKGKKLLLGKPKTSRLSHDGYPKVRLSKKHLSDDVFVHRLVAICFLDKVIGKNYVNHINGIRSDNRLENLEWCTMSENVKHGFVNNGRIAHNKNKTGKLNMRSIPIVAIHRRTGLSTLFESINLASKELNIQWSSIHRTLKGIQKHTRQYDFRYA